MSRLLIAADGASRNVAVTTTTKMAERILATWHVIAQNMPSGFVSTPPSSILLEMFLAEERACYLDIQSLQLTGTSSLPVLERWVWALSDEGMIERKGDTLALSTKGHATVVDIIEKVFAVQRTLD